MKSFDPVFYENVKSEIQFKIKALKIYSSEVESFPHPRSIKSVENLSIQRGIESGLDNAEGFELIRYIS